MNFVESAKVELKREVNADFKKEVIAFANTDGGEIFIGVNNDGTVRGVENCDDVMLQIGNMIRDGIKPDLTAYTHIETLLENNTKIIRVAVLRGTKRPYHLAEKGLKPSGVYVRHGVSSVPATSEVIRHLLRDSDGDVFDKSRSSNQDLTFIYAENYFNNSEVGFSPNNKRSLGLVDIDGYYTNTALLLSDQCQHSIKCAVYEGTGKTKFRSRKEFGGSILKQMDEAYDFLKINNNLNSTLDGLKRIDHPDYPEYALRETLLNTIVHRDYDYSGSTIINIFDNRIEFVSLGGVVRGITMVDILGGVSQPRNTVLASIFYRLELIESYGTGIQRIIESYEGLYQQPEFKPAPASFVVIIPKIDYSLSSFDYNVSREEIVMTLIDKNNGHISRKDVELLNISKHEAIKILNNLISEGFIRRTGSARAVRYVKTNSNADYTVLEKYR